MKLPSNKVSLLIIICTLIVAGVIISPKIDFSRKENLEELKVQDITIERTTFVNHKDEDNDGLLDWQEDLWKTDPKNSDSDGDGTSDGEETNNGRNPLVGGPNDKISDTNVEDFELTEKIYDKYVPGTLTDEVAKNLATNYFSFKQGGVYNDQVGAEIVDSISQELQKISKKPLTYNEASINFSDESNDNLKKYGYEFADIHVKYIQRLSELKQNENYVENVSTLYKNFSEEVIKIKVPISLSKVHLQLANNLDIVSQSFIDLNESEIDPVKGLLAIQNYNEAAQSQLELYKVVANYFKDNGILFDNGTTGELWNIVLQ